MGLIVPPAFVGYTKVVDYKLMTLLTFYVNDSQLNCVGILYVFRVKFSCFAYAYVSISNRNPLTFQRRRWLDR